MKSFNKLALSSATCLHSAALAAALIGLSASTAAMAQDKPADSADEAKADDNSSPIVVTGSRIARPQGLDTPVPVTALTKDDLIGGGTINIGDALNNLPALRSTFSQANSTRFIGTSGQSILDLRGLGSARTLVLVDGRRHITASPGDFLVDTNTIPDDLLERVDVVTGGASAVYGSDAIAGVVNFVLKKHFTGIQLSGQGGISSRHDRGTYFISGTAGKDFADGRGNIALALEYSQQEALYFVQRDELTGAVSGRNQFNLTSNSALDGVTGSDGIIDQAFFRNIRNGTISDGGMLTAVCNAANLANPVRCLPGTSSAQLFGQRYFFMPDGSLVVNNASLDLRLPTNGGTSNTVGGFGSTLRNTGQLDPALKRFSANLLLHYDISDGFKPFLEAKFVRIKANQEGQPSFWQGSIPGFFGGGANLRCDNPYLTAQAYATLQSIGRCSTAVPFGTASTQAFSISRFNVDFGGRGEEHTRDTYRIVGGVEGDFMDDWHYEVVANYGNFHSYENVLNNLWVFNLDGSDGPFLKAIDTTRNASGQIVCRVNAVTVTDPNCVPLNPFGVGAPSAAALKYIHTPSFRIENASELDLTANISGNTGKFLNLPGGPVRFALGGEYRKETANSHWDDLTASGATFLNQLAPNNYPDLTIKEAYGEIELPLLKDVPGFEQLTISGAGRVSGYSSTKPADPILGTPVLTSKFTTYTYNVNAIWAPIHDIRFRVGYSLAVRAPTPSDLFDAQSQNFRNIADPCDVLNINNGISPSTRAANCLADGVPVGFINTPARSATLAVLGGGNSQLTPEKGRSLTIGAVFEPRFIPGFSFTVDYYRINVKNLISTLTAPTIINLCYDLPRPNQYCGLVFRDPTTHEFQDPAAIEGPVNFAKQTTKGIDFDVNYSHTFGSGDRINVRGIATYTWEKLNFVNPTDPTFATQQLMNLGDPAFEGQVSVSYKHGPVSLRYQVHYIGLQSIAAYEAQHSFQGRAPTNADTLPFADYSPTWYHNVRVGFEVKPGYEFYAGIDNVGDKMPPLGDLGTGGGDPFDNIGRYFYAGFKVKL